MAVSLQKGQKISLTKETPGLTRVIVGLGWDEAKPAKRGLFGLGGKTQAIDCDTSALVCVNGKVTNTADVVFYNNLRHPSGAIQHMGDNLTGAGEGDDEQIIIDLDKVPAQYDRIVMSVTIYQARERHQHFGMIANSFIRLVDARNNQEICRYNLTEQYNDATAVIFGEVYRKDGEWKFNAMGQPTQDGGIAELVERFRG